MVVKKPKRSELLVRDIHRQLEEMAGTIKEIVHQEEMAASIFADYSQNNRGDWAMVFVRTKLDACKSQTEQLSRLMAQVLNFGSFCTSARVTTWSKQVIPSLLGRGGQWIGGLRGELFHFERAFPEKALGQVCFRPALDYLRHLISELEFRAKQ